MQDSANGHDDSRHVAWWHAPLLLLLGLAAQPLASWMLGFPDIDHPALVVVGLTALVLVLIAVRSAWRAGVTGGPRVRLGWLLAGVVVVGLVTMVVRVGVDWRRRVADCDFDAGVFGPCPPSVIGDASDVLFTAGLSLLALMAVFSAAFRMGQHRSLQHRVQDLPGSYDD